MKTIAILFLSLLMTKSCQEKKEDLENKPVEVSQTATESNGIEDEKGQPVVKEQGQETARTAEYEASARGFFTKVKFSNNELTVSKDRNSVEKGTVIKITKEEASELNALLQEMQPENLPNMKGPTEKRFYDGAAHANLIVTDNGKTFTGAGFDHGNPPAAIEKLVKKMMLLSEK